MGGVLQGPLERLDLRLHLRPRDKTGQNWSKLVKLLVKLLVKTGQNKKRSVLWPRSTARLTSPGQNLTRLRWEIESGQNRAVNQHGIVAKMVNLGGGGSIRLEGRKAGVRG